VRTHGTAPRRPEPAAPHDHVVAFYDSDTVVQQVVGRYVRDGLSLGERVFVVVPPGTRDLLHSALGNEVAERVEWTTGVCHRELGALFHGYRRLFAEQRAAGTTVRLISEFIDGAGRPDPDRIESYLRFEAVGNEALSPFGHRWACLCDTRTFPGALLDRMRQAHPASLRAAGSPLRNRDYLRPADYLVAHPEQLPPVPDDAAVDVVLQAPEQLRDLRRRLQDWIARPPVDGERAEAAAHAGSILLAVGEVATNALQHGRPPVRVRAWVAGAAVRVRVEGGSDGGVPVAAGYRTGADDPDGMGLLIARGVADTVRIVTDNGITSVSLEFPLGC
jgi:anti-sigma regulatory factor (Ser/Thr protein kinase)